MAMRHGTSGINMISLKKIKEALSRIIPPKEEEIKIPADWAIKPQIEKMNIETIEEWPPKGDNTRHPLNIHKYLVWTAKILFLAYVALSIGFMIEMPFGLILSLPTVAVLLDYIRNDKIIKQVSSWLVPDEHSDITSEE